LNPVPSRSREPLIKLSRVSFRYADPILIGVNLAIHRGDFWVFLGPNGSGKTTLMRLILGFLKPAEGEIRIPHTFSITRQASFVPQKLPALTVTTTVEEFILLGLTGLRLSRREKEERLRRIAGELDLSSLSKARVRELSGGQERRMLLARALIRNPSLLFLDEPTAGLDPVAEEEFLILLGQLWSERDLTVVLITHELEHVRSATHIALFAHRQVFCFEKSSFSLTGEELRGFYREKDPQKVLTIAQKFQEG
jgi:zinc transport system ATP-binding protein